MHATHAHVVHTLYMPNHPITFSSYCHSTAWRLLQALRRAAVRQVAARVPSTTRIHAYAHPSVHCASMHTYVHPSVHMRIHACICAPIHAYAHACMHRWLLNRAIETTTPEHAPPTAAGAGDGYGMMDPTAPFSRGVHNLTLEGHVQCDQTPSPSKVRLCSQPSVTTLGDTPPVPTAVCSTFPSVHTVL